MDFIEKVSSNFLKLKKTVVKGTNMVVEASKLTISLSEKKSTLKDLYEEIGRKVYHSGNEEIVDQLVVSNEISEITRLNAEIENIEAQLAEIKNKQKCPNCGSNIGNNDAYCKICGYKID